MNTDNRSLSLTQHFQFLGGCAQVLQSLENTSQSAKQFFLILAQISTIGMGLEQHGDPYAMKADTEKIEALTKGFGAIKKIPYIGRLGEKLDYHLPDITDHVSLLVACCYLKYLKNYQKVSYQGCITFFLIKPKIEQEVEKSKPRLHSQACFLEQEIKTFCQANNIKYVNVFQLVKKARNEQLVNELNSFLNSSPNDDAVKSEAVAEIGEEAAKHAYLNARQTYETYLATLDELHTTQRQIARLEHGALHPLGVKIGAFFSKEGKSAQIIEVTKTQQKLREKLESLKYGVNPNAYLLSLLDEKNLAREVYELEITKSTGFSL